MATWRNHVRRTHACWSPAATVGEGEEKNCKAVAQNDLRLAIEREKSFHARHFKASLSHTLAIFNWTSLLITSASCAVPSRANVVVHKNYKVGKGTTPTAEFRQNRSKCSLDWRFLSSFKIGMGAIHKMAPVAGLRGTFAHGSMLDVWLVECGREKLTFGELLFAPFA